MKFRKSLSLILAVSTLISCVPTRAIQRVYTPDTLESQPYVQSHTQNQPLFGKPVFGKDSYWSQFRRIRESLPYPLAAFVMRFYPKKISNPADRVVAEGVEALHARLAGSWMNLPRTLLKNDYTRGFGLHKLLLWDRLKERVKRSLYGYLPIPFIDYSRLPIPAIAAQIANQHFQPLQIVAHVDPVDTAVGVADAALAGESAEKITTNKIIKGTATALAFCLLVNPLVSKAGDQIGETAAGLGLSMPSSWLLWAPCAFGLWFAKGLIQDKVVSPVTHKIVDVAGKPLTWLRQKHNHKWNKSIWDHNKPLFDKHFTGTLMIDGENYFDLISELEEKYTQFQSGSEDEALVQRLNKIMIKLNSDKYQWEIRQDSDDEERSKDLNQNIKFGLKNNSCLDCRQLLADGNVDEVCCIGRYRF